MTHQDDWCKDCNHSHDCKGAYEKLSKSSAASVAWRVSLAFLLPMVIFIAFLALLDKFLAEKIPNEPLRGFICVFISIITAFFITMAVKNIISSIKKKSNNKLEG